jgi:hypothetical protein
VNFNWGSGSPAATIGSDSYSVRWTGEVLPRLSEATTFYTSSDDGVRLWVDGRLLIDNWTVHTVTENRGTITLVGGRRYSIRLEYFDSVQAATARLSWSSAGQTKEIIPYRRLFPAP